jgi:hypothetical protein
MSTRGRPLKDIVSSTPVVSARSPRLQAIGVARTSRRSAMIQIACGGLALVTWGCGFFDMVLNGEDSQTMRESNLCDDLGSEYSSRIPSLVELRTDKAGATRYRDLRLGGTEIDPQWVPIADRRANTTGWAQAGNFLKMDFQPPLQRVLAPDSVIYIAYAPAEALDDTEQEQLKTLNAAFGPESGTFHWNGRVYRYSALHKLPCHPPPQ